MDILENVGYSICRTARKIHQHLTACFREYGLTPEQWVAVKFIAESKTELSQKELALLQEKDQNNVKSIVDRLADKDIVARKPNPQDARAFRLSLTDHGKELFSTIARVDDSFTDGVLLGITPAELREFSRILKKIEDNAGRK